MTGLALASMGRQGGGRCGAFLVSLRALLEG
jgi:hypothetical protein